MLHSLGFHFSVGRVPSVGFNVGSGTTSRSFKCFCVTVIKTSLGKAANLSLQGIASTDNPGKQLYLPNNL